MVNDLGKQSYGYDQNNQNIAKMNFVESPCHLSNFGPAAFGCQPPSANPFGCYSYATHSSYNNSNMEHLWSNPSPCNNQPNPPFAFSRPSFPAAYSFPPSQSTPTLIQNDLNFNNKRQIDSVNDQDELTDDFDFDLRRPVKKYICEEKVLEIFDRLHIREGDHYIVEDVPDEDVDHQTKCNPFKHNVSIEEIIDTDCQLEYCSQLKSALQADTDITNKLLKLEQEKLSKALVLYQPNSLLESLRHNDDHDDDEKTVEIIENASDDDEELMEDVSNDAIQIEQISSDDDTDLMVE